MPEKSYKKKHMTSFQLICRCDPFGKYFADASGFLFGQSADAIS